MESMVPASVRIVAVGLNHRSAPIALRETVAFSPAQQSAALTQLKEKFPDCESVILSTCNRVEFYLARPLAGEPQLLTVTNFIAGFHRLEGNDLLPHLYHHEDRAAVEHLFKVTASLDSMVIGETQILGQVKQAYQTAVATGSAGKILHVLFQRALAAGKHVHDSTNLAGGRRSIASVAVDLARSVFDRFDDKTVACIGAGKMATLMLQHLRGLQPGKLLIANRSLAKAEALAAEFNGHAVGFNELNGVLAEADILLTSTGAAEPILTTATFKNLLKPRRYRPLVIVDIAVPRDVETAVGQLPNTYLYNVDDLQKMVDQYRDQRTGEADRTQLLLAEHVDDFLHWYASRDIGPLVKALYEHCHGIARGELDDLFAKNPDLDFARRREIERIMHRVIGKVLHGPITQITSQTESTARPMLAAALKKLFRLSVGEHNNGT